MVHATNLQTLATPVQRFIYPVCQPKKEAMNLPNYIRRITICGVLLFTGASSLHAQFPGPVNAIIGDESFELMYHGSEPGEADEQLRIQTHLAFVESKLRSAATNHLNDDQIRNRRFIIDLLHNYWQAGQFPSNSAYAERRPCFIDDEGNICAVGYLLAASRGWDVAASINERFQYEYLTDMDEPLLAEWANNYGLSLEECAMIQPTYGPPPAPVISYAELKPGYGISSSVMSGVNLAGNIFMLSKKTTGKRAGEIWDRYRWCPINNGDRQYQKKKDIQSVSTVPPVIQDIARKIIFRI
ncbi:MAG: hypothetical protein NVV59_17565 [Chitinophagaceae bacterium]|nr:hypothetical protein [Chitinophagaceae bacterium]